MTAPTTRATARAGVSANVPAAGTAAVPAAAAGVMPAPATVPVLPDDPLAALAVPRPAAHTDVRTANLSLLLRALRYHSASSRTELVRTTGLSKATVSILVGELIARGLVREERPGPAGGVGRPSTVLRAVGDRVAGVGVEIGPHTLSVVTADLTGQVLEHETAVLRATTSQAEQVAEQVSLLLAQRVASLRSRGVHVPAVAVAQTGILDYQTGAVRLSSSLGWHEVPLRRLVSARLAAHLDQPPAVLVENDAKLAALATYRRWAGTGVRNLFYLTAGDGVGAGIVCDGHLLRGWLGQSGEVGHIPLDPEGRQCHCGRRGCWETMVGLDALARALPATSPARDAALPLADRITALRRAYDTDPSRLAPALQEATASLARGLVTLIDVLSPQVVVLSGWMAAFGDLVLPQVRAYLAERQLDPGATVRVEGSELGVWAPAVGGALMALEPALADPGSVPEPA